MLLTTSMSIFSKEKKYPIIYSDKYDISLGGLEKLHPFDAAKYGKVYKYLLKNTKLKKSHFLIPKIIKERDLLKIHSKKYLNSLKSSSNISKIAEIGILSYLPLTFLKNNILLPMKYATGGTVLGAKKALQEGWSINLSGGYHHAKSTSGSGFCFFADIPLAVVNILEKHKDYKILIVDLDAHQGNGLEASLKDYKNSYILDMYNKDIYPKDDKEKKYIDYHYPLNSYVGDEEYINLLKIGLEKALLEVKPDLIIYNAGTDIYEKDPLGNLFISKKGIKKRDEIVFEKALKRKIPILMVLSGGYTKESYQIIGESIKNILEKFKLLK